MFFFVLLGFQTIPNQESLTNRFLETTTVLPKIFHLKGLVITKTKYSFKSYQISFRFLNSKF